MNLLETAQYWTGQGYSVIPIHYYGKRPLAQKLPGGKWEQFQTRTPSHTECRQMFTSQLTNIALVVSNGLVVIDFDIQDVFDYWYQLFPLKTYMVKTRRGVHVYVKTQTPAKNYHSELLDIKAERGYVLIPPSVHPSGYEYKPMNDFGILNVERLTDVLPETFTPEPVKVIGCTQYAGGDDPWAMADNAVEVNSDLIRGIRSNVKITDLIECEQSSRDGRWYVALCPFHDDHTPSFWIDTAKGLCGCRTCNIKEMDVINLYARLHNVSNTQAIYELSKARTS